MFLLLQLKNLSNENGWPFWFFSQPTTFSFAQGSLIHSLQVHIFSLLLFIGVHEESPSKSFQTTKSKKSIAET